jgi:cell division protease FtsH
LRDPQILAGVRRRIEAAEDRALALLAVHQPLLEAMARALTASRELGPEEAEEWLRPLRDPANGRLAAAVSDDLLWP